MRPFILVAPDTYLIYGISDCPACLRARALLMEHNLQYVVVDTDFAAAYRSVLKKKYMWPTLPIICKLKSDEEELIGGYSELVSSLAASEKDI